MQSFQFPSANNTSTCHAQVWLPDQPPVAVVQIVHGMAEHIGRYDEFARYLTDHAIAVCGADLAGHGQTAASDDELGVFGEGSGAGILLADLHTLRTLVQERLPGPPYFLLGHSLGSFVVRQYLTMHAEGLAGALFSGSGDKPTHSGPGLALARLVGLCKGRDYRSRLLDHLVFSGYNRKIPGAAKRSWAWLSRDPETVRAYEVDPRCGFLFSAGAMACTTALVRRVNARAWYRAVPRELPMFFFSGDADPVGGYGKGVERVCTRLRRAGVERVRLTLYPGGRHEMLGELERERVFEDILHWILDVRNAEA